MVNHNRTFNGGKTIHQAVMAIDMDALSEEQLVEWYNRHLIDQPEGAYSVFYDGASRDTNYGHYGDDTYYIQPNDPNKIFDGFDPLLVLLATGKHYKVTDRWVFATMDDSSLYISYDNIRDFIDESDEEYMKDWLDRRLCQGYETDKVMPFLGLVADK